MIGFESLTEYLGLSGRPVNHYSFNFISRPKSKKHRRFVLAEKSIACRHPFGEYLLSEVDFDARANRIAFTFGPTDFDLKPMIIRICLIDQECCGFRLVRDHQVRLPVTIPVESRQATANMEFRPIA